MDIHEHDQQCDENSCRVCQHQGCFELSENEFQCEKKDVTLLTAFNSFSSLDNDDVAVYLCLSCTDQLMIAYRFAEKVKVSDQQFGMKLLNVEVDVAAAEAYNSKLNELVILLEDDDELEPEKITPKRTRKVRKANETATKRIKRETSPKKLIQCDGPVNFALAQYVITSNPSNDDTTIDDQFDENATNPLELDAQLLDDSIDVQTMKCENETSPIRNKVKTLKTSAIVASSLQEIGDLCAITIDGDHDGQSIYQCKYCPKAFAGPYHLMIHTRKSHQCQYCLRAFVKVTDLYKHVKDSHNSFECLLCGRVFRTNGNLRQHMRKNHSVFLPAHVSLLNVDEAKHNDDTEEIPE